MEPATIAVAAVSFIALEIAAGGLKEIGKEIYGKVKELLKPDEIIKLDLLEKYPESKELKGEVAEVLTKRLEENPGKIKEFDELVKKIPSVQVKQNKLEIKGDGNIALQDISGSDIKIHK